MATAEAHIDSHAHDDHEHKDNFITKYIFSQDHKTIAKQFLITGIIWAVIGGAMSAIFRIQFGFPDADLGWLKPLLGKWISAEGALDPEFYLALVTMHGTIMVFFVLTAGLSGTFSNFLIPLQIGARDMASGFMNMLSYWFFFLSGVLMFISLFLETGPASGGWVVYPPLSALPQAMEGSGLGMTNVVDSHGILYCILSIRRHQLHHNNHQSKNKRNVNVEITIDNLGIFLTAVIGVLSFPVLVAAALLLVMDRSFGTSFYLSEIYIAGEALPNVGGSPILYQHLFWFLGHPEVYIVLLPALGITSEIIATNSRKPIFGYKAMVFSMLGITVLSFVVWAHHMFVSGLNPFLGSIFMFLTLIIAIPSAVKTFNYLTTLWKGNIIFTPAMLFSIGLVSVFISGGITGIFLGNSAIDIQLHDTYFVVAHFHLVMGAASFFGMVAGVYHWFPKMFGRMLDEKLGYIHFWLTFIGVYMVFFPMHYVGIAGFPRRYYSFTNFDAFSGFTDLNTFITIAALITFVAQFIFLFNFFYSIFRGRKATANPWKSNTLEWTTPLRPEHGNWPGEIPPVYRWSYDYSKPGAPEDFIPQNVPFSQTPESNFPHENDEIAFEKDVDEMVVDDTGEFH